MPISAIGSIDSAPLLDSAGTKIAGAPESGRNVHSFSDVLANALTDVNKLQQNAGVAVEKLAKGEDIDVHQVMIAMEQASTALQLTLQVRNKMVDAYTEIMRTQV